MTTTPNAQPTPPPMIHTAQSAVHDVTTLVAYQAADGRVHVERVTVYLANVLHDMRLTVPIP